MAYDIETLELSQIGQWPTVIKVGVYGLLCSIVLYLGYTLWLEDSWNTLQQKKNQILVLQQELENVAKQMTVFSAEVKEDYVYQMNLALEAANRQLPIKHEKAKLLREISEQALQCRLQIDSLKPEAPIHKGLYQEYPLILSVKGDFHGMGEFVSRLANLSPMITLQEYSVRGHQTRQVLDMQLRFHTYGIIDVSENDDPMSLDAP